MTHHWTDYDHYDDNQEDEPLEFTGIVKAITEKAILIDMGELDIWIPKSQMTSPYEPEVKEELDFEIPAWLAEAKDLI